MQFFNQGLRHHQAIEWILMVKCHRGQPVSVALDLVTINNDSRISTTTWQHEGKVETLRRIYKP